MLNSRSGACDTVVGGSINCAAQAVWLPEDAPAVVLSGLTVSEYGRSVNPSAVCTASR